MNTLPTMTAPDERERVMTQLSITYDGRRYTYGRYRYDRLADAVNYATLQRTRSFGADDDEHVMPPDEVEVPNEAQRRLMADLAITYQDGVYRLGPFRYDRLADAVNYAHLQSSPPCA